MHRPRGNPEPRPAQEEKHGIDTNKLVLTTIADAEPTMRKTCQYLSHVEHLYWIPSADRREDADRQIFQPVVTVTQSELWNQRVTVINHISDLSRTNRVDAVGEFTSPWAFINCAINVCFAGENLKHSWWHDKPQSRLGSRAEHFWTPLGVPSTVKQRLTFRTHETRKLITTNRSIFLACQGLHPGGAHSYIKIHQEKWHFWPFLD